MPLTKSGEEIDWKEYFHRWKLGIQGITMEQKLTVQIRGVQIMIIGILMGLFVSIFGWKKLWWVVIILIGVLINTIVQYLGLLQQKIMFNNINKQLEGGNQDGRI